MKAKKECPCGSNLPQENCCQKIHTNIHLAKTAEALMRSRYTAYTLADGDYLMQSHFSKTRPIQEKKEIVRWSKSVKWLRLEILNQTRGQENDAIGTVEFKTYFLDKGELDVIHENSQFVKENGHWVYVDVVKT